MMATDFMISRHSISQCAELSGPDAGRPHHEQVTGSSRVSPTGTLAGRFSLHLEKPDELVAKSKHVELWRAENHGPVAVIERPSRGLARPQLQKRGLLVGKRELRDAIPFADHGLDPDRQI